MAVMSGVLPHVGAGGCGFVFASMLSAALTSVWIRSALMDAAGRLLFLLSVGLLCLGSVMMSVVLLFSHSSSGTVKL